MASTEAEPVLVAELTDPADEQVIVNLIQSLMKNVQRRDMLRDDLHQKQNNFRNILVELDRENTSLKVENTSLRNYSDQQKKMISSLEERICKLDNQVDSLLYKLNNANDALKNMQQAVRDRDRQLRQHAIDKQKMIEKCSNKIQAETDRITKELETKLHEQREQLESYIKKKDEKLKLMKQILINNDNTSENTTVAAQSDPKLKTEAPEEPISTIFAKKLSTTATIDSQAPSTSTIVSVDTTTKSDTEATRNSKDSIELTCRLSRRDKVPVVNPRYQSQNANKWIDHRPGRLVPVGTILQPQTPSKRSVAKLIDPKPFTSRSARYCLYAQEQDTDGELETRLYKANVLPTSGGGAQVVFNDIEYLKQISPARQKQHSRPVDAESSSVHSENVE